MTVLKKGDIVKARILDLKSNDAYCEILNSEHEDILNCIGLCKIKNSNYTKTNSTIIMPLMPGFIFDATVESISSTNYIILKQV